MLLCFTEVLPGCCLLLFVGREDEDKQGAIDLDLIHHGEGDGDLGFVGIRLGVKLLVVVCEDHPHISRESAVLVATEAFPDLHSKCGFVCLLLGIPFKDPLIDCFEGCRVDMDQEGGSGSAEGSTKVDGGEESPLTGFDDLHESWG